MQQTGLPFDSPDVPDRSGPPTTPVLPALVFVRHPRARRYIVSVRPDGAVRVTVPRRGSRREAEAFATSQRDWIDRQLRRLEDRRATPAAPAASDAELRRRARARAS